MAEQRNFRMRVFFRKSGRIALLSHLEVARALERTVRRAGLPYAISSGFSPHMKIAFGAALPVGVGGTHECFDLQLTRYVHPDEAYTALFDASVSELLVIACEYIGAKDPAASIAYPISGYRVVLSQVMDSAPSIPETVTVIRKKKERDLVVDDFLVEGVEVEGNILTFSLIAKPSGSLRPDVFVDALLVGHSDIVPLSITRVSQHS